MNLKNKILYNLTEKIILKNKKFKGIHKGESCYLFGNAKSLKYYDLSLFNDRVSIGCNQLYLHKDFSEIKMNYYYDADPHIQESQARLEYITTIKETLEEIINNIRWRHSSIKNAIDWRKFESGA